MKIVSKKLNSKKIKIFFIILLLLSIASIIGFKYFLENRNKKVKEEFVSDPIAPKEISFERYDVEFDGKNISYYYDQNGNLVILIDGEEYVLIEGNVYKKDSNGKLIIVEDEKITSVFDKAKRIANNPFVQEEPKEKEEAAYNEEDEYKKIADTLGITVDELKQRLNDKNLTLSDLITMAEEDPNSLSVIINPNIKNPEKGERNLLSEIFTPKNTVTSSTNEVPFTARIKNLSSSSVPSSSSSNSESFKFPDLSMPKLNPSDFLPSKDKTSNEKNIEWQNQHKDVQSGGTFLNENTIARGTIVSLTLINGLNSDLPGTLIAQVNSNVYDSLTGDNLLIPKGTKLLARYNSAISFGQSRLLIAWTDLIRPDGFVMNLPGFEGTDNLGKSGYSGSVDNHIWSLIGGVFLATLMDLGIGEVNFQAKKAGVDRLNNPIQSVTNTTESIGGKYINKMIDRAPTLTIEIGKQVKMLVNSDISLPDVKY